MHSISVHLQECVCFSFQSNKLSLFHLFSFPHQQHSFVLLLISNLNGVQELACGADILCGALVKLIDAFIYSFIYFFTQQLEYQPKMSDNLLGTITDINEAHILALNNSCYSRNRVVVRIL